MAAPPTQGSPRRCLNSETASSAPEALKSDDLSTSPMAAPSAHEPPYGCPGPQIPSSIHPGLDRAPFAEEPPCPCPNPGTPSSAPEALKSDVPPTSPMGAPFAQESFCPCRNPETASSAPEALNSDDPPIPMAAPSAQGFPQGCPCPQIPRSVMQDALDCNDVVQCILGQVSLATGNMKHVLVCRRWAQNARPSQRALCLKKVMGLEDMDAAGGLYGTGGKFHELAVLDVTAKELVDKFIDLCGSSGKLESVRIFCPEYGVPATLVSRCWPDRSSDEAYGRLFTANPGLQRVHLAHTFSSLPNGLSALHGLKELRMNYRNLGVFRDIMGVVVKLTQLEGLHLYPQHLGKFCAMRIVTRGGVTGLGIPHAFSRLQNLRELSIHVHEALPTTFSALAALRTLTLNTGQLQMDAQVEALPNLRKLILARAAIQSAPRGSSSLRSLELFNCPYIVRMEGLAAITGLEELVVKKCRGIKVIPPALGSLSNLQRLAMDGLTTLSGLRNGTDNLKALELSLSSNVVKVGLVSCLTMLEELHISKSEGVRVIPSCWSCLVSLKKLSLDGLSKLHTLEHGLASLTMLRTLSIRSCPNIRKLPKGLLSLNLNEESKNELLELADGITVSQLMGLMEPADLTSAVDFAFAAAVARARNGSGGSRRTCDNAHMQTSSEEPS